MSYQGKNITVSLISFTVILGFYSFRILQMIWFGSFNSTNVFRLWGIVIILSIVITIIATILTHIGSSIVQAVKTGEENPEVDDLEDERDKLIDLRGIKVTYIVFSMGIFLSMLTYVLGYSPLVMFSLLIFFGITGQISGDISRVVLYRKGF